MVDGPLRGSALRRESQIRSILAVADVSAGLLALVAISEFYPHDSVVGSQSLLMLPVLVLIARALGLYHKDEIRLRQTALDEAPDLFQLATMFALGVWLTRHLLGGGAVTGAHVMTLLIGFFALAFLLRLVARAVAGRVVPAERCLVIGDSATAGRLSRTLGVPTYGSTVAASISCPTEESERTHFEALSHPTSLARLVGEERVDRLIIAPRHPNASHVQPLINAAKTNGLRVTLVPFLGEIVGAAAEVESVGGVTVLGLPRFELPRSAKVVKRSLDIGGAVIGLLTAAPLMGALAVLIRLDSRGPIFFRQVRMGRDGAPFVILKFRTMVDGADAHKAELMHKNESVGLFKIAADPRITRVGRVLRKTSLDELPQLWNVLRGDMSLVGPRPLVADEDARVVGWFRHRLQLQPGMTGHWQVLGSSRIPMDDMIRIDYLYVVNWSLWGDIKVLLQTVPYVLSRRGL